MTKFTFDLNADSAPVLDRVIEAYGFTSKLMLAQHIGIAPSSLSSRYKRGGFPADIVLKCVSETGVNLEWLATGNGKRFNNDELDLIKFNQYKLVEWKLYHSGVLMFDKAMFSPGLAIPLDPIGILYEQTQYIIDRKFTDVYDAQWLVDIEGRISLRHLVIIPANRLRVSGAGMPFDCNLDDIKILGRVIMTCVGC